MTSLLPPLLTPTDFSPAELSAVRIDGEALALAECLSPFGLDDTTSRALALDQSRPHGTIIERGSALWVHGALATAPHPMQLAIPRDHRLRPPKASGCEYRVIALKAQHIVRISGVPVTSPARTLFDLLTVPEQPDNDTMDACHTLASRKPKAVAEAINIARLAIGMQYTVRALHYLRLLTPTSADH